MTQKIVIALLVSALAACGSKSKNTNTVPQNKGDATTDKSGSNGGATYGGAMKPTTPTTGGTADPCGG